MLSLFVQTSTSLWQDPFWYHFWTGLVLSAAFGFVGIVLLLLGYLMFDWITPRIDVQKELTEKNMAVATVIAALLLGIAYIAAHVVQ
jgi:putative membrane protein